MSDPSLRDVVRHCLADLDRWDQRRAELVDRLHREGRRLVRTRGEDIMQVLDADTEEVLWTGTGEAYWSGAEFDTSWVDVDYVTTQVAEDPPDEPMQGVPDELLEAVREWTSAHRAEAIAYVGVDQAD